MSYPPPQPPRPTGPSTPPPPPRGLMTADIPMPVHNPPHPPSDPPRPEQPPDQPKPGHQRLLNVAWLIGGASAVAVVLLGVVLPAVAWAQVTYVWPAP